MRFESKLLKVGYGYDQSGQVVDKTQDNIRDTNNPIRNPDKVDHNPMNDGRDGTIQPMEVQDIHRSKEKLNPHVT